MLAAGLSKRMGSPKLLLDLGGSPVLSRVLSCAASLNWEERLAVVGEPREGLGRICLEQGFPYVYNPQRSMGQSTSVILGVSEMSPELDGYLFLQGDQPFVSPELLTALKTAFDRQHDPCAIIVPVYEDKRRTPVIFGSFWRQELLKLSGDQGGRQIMSRYPEAVTLLPWHEGRSFLDIDTPEDYERVRKEQMRLEDET